MDSNALKERLRPLLEEFVRDNYPGCELGAFILNVFATNGSDEVSQDIIAEGNDAKVSDVEASIYAMRAIADHFNEIRAASDPTDQTPKPMAQA